MAGLRERKKERQRQEILEAAVALFKARGYDRTRVADVVESAAISEATFFNYFPTKRTVLDELALVQVELLSETLRYQLHSGEGPVPDRLRETMRAVAVAIARDPGLQEVIYTRSSLFHSSGTLKERSLVMYDLLSQLIAAGQRRGEIRRGVDSVQIAEVVIAVFHLTTVNWLIGWWRKRGELEPRLVTAIDMVLGGCEA